MTEKKKLKPGPRPMSDKGTKTLWVRLPVETADKVEKNAKKEKRSVSSIIRTIVENTL